MEKLLDEYRAAFGESFPLMMFMGIPEDEVKKVIQNCLNERIAFDTDSIPDEIY